MESSQSARFLPSLHLNTSCTHLLNDFYSKIAQGKNQMDKEQLLEGLFPYIKMGITNPQDPEKVWVGMQIIAANAKNWQNVNNKLGGLYNTVYRATSITSFTSSYNPQVTNIDFTTKALESARNTLESEIPKQISSWKNQNHTNDETQTLINELNTLLDLIMTVSEVVGRLGITYEENKENANPIFEESGKLSKFLAKLDLEIQDLETIFNDSQQFKTIEVNNEKQPAMNLASLLKKSTIVGSEESMVKINQPIFFELKFESEEQANKWYVRQSEFAVNQCQKDLKQVQTHKDFKTLNMCVPELFEKFANSVDLAFQKNGKGEEISQFVTEVSAKMIENGVSDKLKPLLSNPKSFSYLLKAIAKNGQESDFRLFFKTLLNEKQTGPADLVKAPLVLNEILRSIAFYNLFKN